MSQNSSFDPITALFVAVPAVALASIGGIGVVGGGLAFGLSSLELGAIGAAGARLGGHVPVQHRAASGRVVADAGRACRAGKAAPPAAANL